MFGSFSRRLCGRDHRAAKHSHDGNIFRINAVAYAAFGPTHVHFTTFDIYGRYEVTQHLNLHASILNATNTHAPADWVTYASPILSTPYNPSLHQSGAVGPFFNLGATYTF